MINHIEPKIDNNILKLYQLIKSKGKAFWIYGETLCDLCFTEITPLHFQIATTLEQEQFLALNGINLSHKNIKNNELVFCIQNDNLQLLEGDILPRNIENKLYIELLFVNHQFCSELKENIIPIDQFAWDFNNFYHQKKVMEIFES